MAIDQSGWPDRKARVPSIGSTIHSRGARRRAGSSVVSSDSQAASGRASMRRTLRKESTATSASVTGEPPCFDQTRAVVFPPRRK